MATGHFFVTSHQRMFGRIKRPLNMWKTFPPTDNFGSIEPHLKNYIGHIRQSSKHPGIHLFDTNLF